MIGQLPPKDWASRISQDAPRVAEVHLYRSRLSAAIMGCLAEIIRQVLE